MLIQELAWWMCDHDWTMQYFPSTNKSSVCVLILQLLFSQHLSITAVVHKRESHKIHAFISSNSSTRSRCLYCDISSENPPRNQQHSRGLLLQGSRILEQPLLVKNQSSAWRLIKSLHNRLRRGKKEDHIHCTRRSNVLRWHSSHSIHCSSILSRFSNWYTLQETAN